MPSDHVIAADPAHLEKLKSLITMADKIRYACGVVEVPTTRAVMQWLMAHGEHVNRLYTFNIVSEWRKDRGLEDTGDLVALTPELLAELDALQKPDPEATVILPAVTPDTRPDDAPEPAVDTTLDAPGVAAEAAPAKARKTRTRKTPAKAAETAPLPDTTDTTPVASADTAPAATVETPAPVDTAPAAETAAVPAVETAAALSTAETAVVPTAETVAVPAVETATTGAVTTGTGAVDTRTVAAETVAFAAPAEPVVPVAVPSEPARDAAGLAVPPVPSTALVPVETVSLDRAAVAPLAPPSPVIAAPVEVDAATAAPAPAQLGKVPALLRWAGGAAWIVVLGAALGISWWSLFDYASDFGIPVPLAAVVSLVFDAAALIVAGLAHRYAVSPYSGIGPRLALLALLAGSVYLNWMHAANKGYGIEASIMFAAPAAVGIVLFELHTGWHSRTERAARGRIARPLPLIGLWGWVLHPLQSVVTVWTVSRARGRAVREAELNRIRALRAAG